MRCVAKIEGKFLCLAPDHIGFDDIAKPVAQTRQTALFRQPAANPANGRE
jgi:hypothetical protein